MEEKLVGKTIVKAKIKKLPISTRSYDKGKEYDDKPILELEMSDGSKFIILACYGGYTGKSEDEYPAFITMKETKEAFE